jgi:tetratricopeptide (TPR) repeat protein
MKLSGWVVIACASMQLCRVDAAAQPEPSHDDLAAAEALFIEGRELTAEGRFAEACVKFETSMALAPRLGVQLNVANCYERIGKTASAWRAFGEAAALARQLADEREAFARQRYQALVRTLAKLIIKAPAGAPIPDLVVLRDGATIAPSSYGVAIPVDPGVHTVTVTAPGRISWSAPTTIVAAGEVVTVLVPALPIRREPRADVTSAPPESARRRLTPATWIAAGIGAAGIGFGTVLGLSARSLWQQARPGCDASHVCTDAAFALAERSRRDGTLSTVGFAIGGASLVAGAVLYLRSPLDRDRTTRVIPVIAPGAAMVAMTGAF